MKLSRLTPQWTLATFGLLLAVVLLVPMPVMHRAVAAVLDSMHGPAFAVLAWLVCRVLIDRAWLTSRRAGWAAFAAIVALGAATEAVQFCVGREFSVKDMVANALGAAAGTLWAVASAGRARWSPRTLRIGAAGLLALAMTFLPLNLADTVIQYREFPVLASFEQPLERLRWSAQRAQMRRSKGRATDGQWSLRVDLPPGEYSGLGMPKPVPDWSGYRELSFDVALNEGPPLDWYVLIEDLASRKTPEHRFERRFRLQPGSQRIVIPLADVAHGSRERPLDLARIGRLHFFTVGLAEPRTLFLDNLRLRR